MMKKIIIAITFITGIIASSFAEKSSADATALNIFKVLITDKGMAAWKKKDLYNEKSFLFKGQEISAYCKSGKLIGLSCTLIDAHELPKEILNGIKKKYNDDEITYTLIFMNNNGHVSYYAVLKNKNIYTAIKISETCKLRVIKKLHIK